MFEMEMLNNINFYRAKKSSHLSSIKSNDNRLPIGLLAISDMTDTWS